MPFSVCVSSGERAQFFDLIVTKTNMRPFLAAPWHRLGSLALVMSLTRPDSSRTDRTEFLSRMRTLLTYRVPFGHLRSEQAAVCTRPP